MADSVNKEVIVKIVPDTSEIDSGIDKINDKLGDVGKGVETKAFKTLKEQLKEATQEAIRLQLAGQENTKSYREAISTIAELRDQQDVLNRTVAAFDPGNKYNAFIGIAQSAAGVVQGYAGAMTFLGVESATAQEAIAKLQGIMAFTDAINQLGDLQDFYKAFILQITKATAAKQAETVATEAGAVATEGARVATTGLGTAFKALGIGLLISAVAYLATNWDKVTETVNKFLPAGNTVSTLFDKITSYAMGAGSAILKYIATPFKAIKALLDGDLDGFKKAFAEGFNFKKNFTDAYNKQELSNQEDHNRKLFEENIKQREKQLAVLQARGRDTYNFERKILTDKLKLYKKGTEDYEKYLQDLRILDASHQRQMEEDRKRKANAPKERKDLERVDTITGDEISPLPPLSDTENQLSLDTALRYKYETLNTEIAKKAADDRIRIAEEEAALKIQKLYVVGDALGVASQLFKEHTIANKGLMIASATMNAYAAISEILSAKSVLPEPFGSIQKAASATAIGINAWKQVKGIAGVNVGGSSGGGGSMGSAPSFSAPVINSTKIGNSGPQDVRVVNQEDQVLEARISEKEIKRSEQRRNFAENLTTI